MSAVPIPKYSPAEYLALEENCDYRSQYYYGEIFAMAGASRRHNVIAMNISARLHAALRERGCEIYQTDMRVKVSSDLYTYPEVVIVCGEPQIERLHGENLLNPLILIEVMSPSTEKFDRGDKSRLYRLMPSVKEYLLVSQEKTHVEHFIRQENGDWLLKESSEMTDIVNFPSIDCSLSIAEIYERIDLTEPVTEI